MWGFIFIGVFLLILGFYSFKDIIIWDNVINSFFDWFSETMVYGSMTIGFSFFIMCFFGTFDYKLYSWCLVAANLMQTTSLLFIKPYRDFVVELVENLKMP